MSDPSIKYEGLLAPQLTEEEEAAKRKKVFTEYLAACAREERAERERIAASVALLKKMAALNLPADDPRRLYHDNFSGHPYYVSQAWAYQWAIDHPGVPLPLNVKVMSALPATYTFTLLDERKPRLLYSVTMPTPAESPDRNKHKTHLARGAQWKREKGRRR